MLLLCDAMLYRLAKFPGQAKSGGDMRIDQSKVLGWLRAQPLSNDLLNQYKVAFFKAQMLYHYDLNLSDRSGCRAITDLIEELGNMNSENAHRPHSRGSSACTEDDAKIISEARDNLEYLVLDHTSS